MKATNFIILAISFMLVGGCFKSEDPPCPGNTYKFIPKAVISYLPYKLGQSIKFQKFSDTTFIKEITFRIDTILYIKEGVSINGMPACVSYDTTEKYQIILTNLTEPTNDITISINGSLDDRHSPLAQASACAFHPTHACYPQQPNKLPPEFFYYQKQLFFSGI